MISFMALIISDLISEVNCGIMLRLEKRSDMMETIGHTTILEPEVALAYYEFWKVFWLYACIIWTPTLVTVAWRLKF